MSPPLITPNTCQTCPFKFTITAGTSRQMMCRRFPPVPFPINNPMFGPSHPEHQPILGYQSTFPNVQPDWWCGEHPGLKTFTFAPVKDHVGGMQALGSS